MEKELVISVVVPIYNAEKFVRRAVESVLCQMDGRIELILVDDGSRDTSGSICDEYAAKHPDIHVIHKSNGGTSSAKNRGIEVAKGRYLSFLDSDDYLEPDAYSQIIPVLLKHCPDCLDFGWKYVNSQGDVTETLHQCRKNTLMSVQELEAVILPPLLNLRKDDAHFVYDYCWNKLFRAEIIHQFGVRFDEDKRAWEDRVFLLRHLKHCRNYYSMDKCFYNYAYTPNSLGQRYFLDFFKILVFNFCHYQELYEDRFDFNTKYANDYRVSSVERMIYRSLEQQENRQIIRNNILEALRNEQVVQWYTRWQPDDRSSSQVRSLVIAGDCEKALGYYIKRAAQTNRKRAFRHMKQRMKNTVRTVLGR